MSNELMRFFIGLCLLLFGFTMSFLIDNKIYKELNKKKCYQTIHQDIILSTHQLKNKTPSLGGIGIIISFLLGQLVFNINIFKSLKYQVFIFIIISFFIIGLIDDYIKTFKKNYKGLSGIIRFLIEVLIVVIALAILNYGQKSEWIFYLGIRKISIYLGGIFIPFVIFILVGSANAMNLTDGLDGLASLLFLEALLPYIVFCLIDKNYLLLNVYLGFFGSVSGFIILNIKPAKMFMGDCGSLMLGVFLGFGAFIMHKEGTLIISAMILIIETMSVIIQVIYFKFTKKRIFLMAPLHHHFEMKGVPEWKVVMSFYIVGFIFSFLTILMGLML